jgi:hypothetical protein
MSSSDRQRRYCDEDKDDEDDGVSHTFCSYQ